MIAVAIRARHDAASRALLERLEKAEAQCVELGRMTAQRNIVMKERDRYKTRMEELERELAARR